MGGPRCWLLRTGRIRGGPGPLPVSVPLTSRDNPSARREGGDVATKPLSSPLLPQTLPALQASAQAHPPAIPICRAPPSTSLGFPASRPRPGEAWNPPVMPSKQAGHESLCPVAGALPKGRAPGFSLGLPPASSQARPACRSQREVSGTRHMRQCLASLVPCPHAQPSTGPLTLHSLWGAGQDPQAGLSLLSPQLLTPALTRAVIMPTSAAPLQSTSRPQMEEVRS